MSALAVIEGELLEEVPAYAPLTADEARALTGRLRGALEVAHGLLLQAYHGAAHTALGYRTWAAYCAAELADLQHTRLPRPQRRALVDQLHGQGMTRRAIATGLGLDESTVRADLRVVRDDERAPVPVLEPAPAPPALEAAPAPAVPGLVRVVVLAAAAGVDGVTNLDVQAALGWHHGQAGGALSRLHAQGRLVRLTERRDRHAVYVVEAYVSGRTRVAPRAS